MKEALRSSKPRGLLQLMKRVQDRLDRDSFSILAAYSPPVRLASVYEMYINKWYSLVAAILLQLMGGLCYTFSLYSSSLKTALNVDQPSLEFIASCLLSGGYFSWIPGEGIGLTCMEE